MEVMESGFLWNYSKMEMGRMITDRNGGKKEIVDGQATQVGIVGSRGKVENLDF